MLSMIVELHDCFLGNVMSGFGLFFRELVQQISWLT